MLITVIMTGCGTNNDSSLANVLSTNTIFDDIIVEEDAYEIEVSNIQKKDIELITEEISSKDTDDLSEEVITDDSVYVNAVKDLLNKNVLPDGDDFENYAPLILENNHYAVFDIDNDNKDELLIDISDSCTAGMVLYIYDYDESKNRFTSENWLFPTDCHIYDNGIITTAVGHSGGVSDDENWPYKIFFYNPIIDQYQLYAEVEPWVDSFSHIRPSWGDEECEVFPTEVDTDKCGIVYGITIGENGDKKYFSQSDYLLCYDAIFDGANELEINWIPFSEIE